MTFPTFIRSIAARKMATKRYGIANTYRGNGLQNTIARRPA